jgi:adenine deaminase
MMDMLDWPGCYGLEEPPCGPLRNELPGVLELFERTLEKRLVITGHGAGLDARGLQAYAAIGTSTDHEAVTLEEGLMRIRGGMTSFLRLSTGADHMSDILRAVTEQRLDPRSIAFCSDEASPAKLVEQGTVAANLRLAIASGVSPITAVQMATINAAEAFSAQSDIGQVAPGRFADLLLVDDLRSFAIDRVIVGGRVRVQGGGLVEPLPTVEYPADLRRTVTVAEPVTSTSLATTSQTGDGEVRVRVIGVADGAYTTDERIQTLRVQDGVVRPDLERDVLPIAMIDRLGKGTGAGTGFAQGFGLKRGALGSTVNAVCENLVLVGASLEEMALAARTLIEVGGGFVVVEGDEVRALFETPILGMISDEPIDVALRKFKALNAAAAALGCPLSSPFTSLEFTFCCGEIPEIKMSEEGLVRTGTGERLEVVLSAAEDSR